MSKAPSLREEVQALTGRLAVGEREALTPLYRLLWPRVSRFCVAALASTSEGEDAAQDALLTFFRRVSAFDPERDALGWCLAIAAAECRTVRGRGRRRRALLHRFGSPHAAAAAATADEAVHLEQRRMEIEPLLEELPQAERETIASILRGDDAPHDAAWRKRKQRALARLRSLWTRGAETVGEKTP